jgi:hypothetical protein
MRYFADMLSDYAWHIDRGLIKFSSDFNAYCVRENLISQFPSFSDLRLSDVDDFKL